MIVCRPKTDRYWFGTHETEIPGYGLVRFSKPLLEQVLAENNYVTVIRTFSFDQTPQGRDYWYGQMTKEILTFEDKRFFQRLLGTSPEDSEENINEDAKGY